MNEVEHGAAFVVVRLAGAALALAGGSLAGLAASEVWCAPTATEGVLHVLFAGAAAVVGVATSILAWRPATAVKVLIGGALLAALLAPFAARWAETRETARIERTRAALLALGEAVEAHRARHASLPGRTGSADRLVRALAASESLPVLDGWGGEIRYLREDEGYALVAPCRCRRHDSARPISPEEQEALGVRADMVLRDGEWEAWPGSS